MSERSPVELDPGSIDVDLAQVKARSVKGLVALTTRTFLVYLISTGATFFLTVLLSPEIYGTFFLVSAVINFLTYFSDVGLAAALIQKPEKINNSDLATTFTIQQILVIVLVTLLFLFTPSIKDYYNLSTQGVWLLWSLAISFILSSLKTIPTALLERDLEFDKLVIPQVAENIVYNVVVVFFAYQGYGITSFAVAVLARGIVGLLLIYAIKPWMPRIEIKTDSLKGLLKFGLPYQTNSLLAVVKDDGMTLVLGGIVGQTGLGYLGWANKWVSLPLRFFMDNITKVAFPAYSRVQHDREMLRRGVEKTLYFMVLITFPIFAGMGALAQPMVGLIPRYEKWTPALFPFYMYLINAAWASLSTPLTNTLNAIGKIKMTFGLMIMWTVLTWILMPSLGLRYGYVGVSVAAAIISFTSIIVLILVYKELKINYSILLPPILSSTIMGGIVFVSGRTLIGNWAILGSIVIGVAVYAVLLFLFDATRIRAELQSLLKHNQ